jgi:hypothetical protein
MPAGEEFGVSVVGRPPGVPGSALPGTSTTRAGKCCPSRTRNTPHPAPVPRPSQDTLSVRIELGGSGHERERSSAVPPSRSLNWRGCGRCRPPVGRSVVKSRRSASPGVRRGSGGSPAGGSSVRDSGSISAPVLRMSVQQDHSAQHSGWHTILFAPHQALTGPRLRIPMLRRESRKSPGSLAAALLGKTRRPAPPGAGRGERRPVRC